MANKIIQTIRRALKDNSDRKIQNGAHRVFKEKVALHGVKIPLVNKLAKDFFQQVKNLDKNDIFALGEELLKSGYSEEAFIAFEWSYSLRDSYTEADFKVLEHWLKAYISNWAECDTLCNHSMGAFIEKFPKYIHALKKWARSSNRWVKRAAAVTLILPARRGMFLEDVLEIAGILLLDQDDLVQKGYGWMLKEASREHPKEVLKFIIKHKKEMPRTALRYAVEKMPAALKRLALAKS